MGKTVGTGSGFALLAAVAALVAPPVWANDAYRGVRPNIQVQPQQPNVVIVPSGPVRTWVPGQWVQGQYGPVWVDGHWVVTHPGHPVQHFHGGQRGRDLDRDGIANRHDRDMDGDGVLNWRDRAPRNSNFR